MIRSGTLSSETHVLVVAAHPDDEVLGAGGLLAHHPGCSVALVSEGTSNETIARGGRGYGEFLAAKRTATQEAMTILQAMTVREGEFPDQRLALTRPLQDWIETTIEETRPDVVLTHSLAELNHDHRIVAEAVAVACRPFCATGLPVRWVLAFHVDPLGLPGQPHEPTIILPLADAELQRKLQACRAYEKAGALRTWPHPRSVRAVEMQARALGSRWGLSAAEGYSVIWGRV